MPDPITATIVTALVAGAIDVVKPAATEAVKDGYNKLKSSLVKKFGKESSVSKAVELVEENPESASRKGMLEEELANVEDQLGEEAQLAEDLIQAINASGSTTITATLTGSGAQAIGTGAAAAGAGGVAVSGGTVQGGIHMGDEVHGDKIGGDKVGGDKITVGDIKGSSAVAIGSGATANVSSGQQSRSMEVDYDALFAGLQRIVRENAPYESAKVEKLKAQVKLGEGADDDEIASLIHEIVTEVPGTKEAIKKLFSHPEVSKTAGSATKFALKIM